MNQYNDCKLEFFQANGATSSDLQDAQREWLIIAGLAPEHNQDMFNQYLLDNGYTGAYSDMSTQFWIDQGCYA